METLSDRMPEQRQGELPSVVCQLVVLPCVIEPIEVVDDLEQTERGDAGFGSTGR